MNLATIKAIKKRNNKNCSTTLIIVDNTQNIEDADSYFIVQQRQSLLTTHPKIRLFDNTYRCCHNTFVTFMSPIHFINGLFLLTTTSIIVDNTQGNKIVRQHISLLTTHLRHLCHRFISLVIVQQHLSLLTTHKTFRLLIPLLIFSGLQQGFMFADFNKAYVTCSLGVEYVGYSMIVMGLASVVSAVLVAVCAKHVQREVVFGIGGILHMGLMIGFLIWIPKKNLVIYFFLSAAWGMCDAVWQTQCNSKFTILKS
ncbi:hypothetical protein KUTeg_011681 [Tegillarca granosa]|uniref:UNC93-like protein n=1 Tax=Tegillarca granosa TaxID=220873 RepID=A0ABQ9EXC2_TEGGR|nr:hypothetical protein KUTeg_011681 [Tegillarca granosa]